MGKYETGGEAGPRVVRGYLGVSSLWPLTIGVVGLLSCSVGILKSNHADAEQEFGKRVSVRGAGANSRKIPGVSKAGWETTH